MSWVFFHEQTGYREFDKLPDFWQNISNFYALESNLVYLRSLGWYPLVDDTQPLSNHLTQTHGPVSYTLDTTSHIVHKFSPIIDVDNPVPLSMLFEESRHSFMQSLRQQRNTLIQDSDWTQLFDVQSVKSQEWKDSWAAYRQQLRDLPAQYSMPPLDTEIDINNVIWPKQPE